MDITIIDGTCARDIKVNRKQRIEDTVTVLRKCGLLERQEFNFYTIFSKRKEIRINRHLTYEQAEIYTGDILYIEGE